MADATLDDLLRRQQAMTALAATLVDDQDPEHVLQVAAQLQGMASEIEALAKDLAARTPVATPPAYVEVVLTEDQRQRIEAQTGVRLETVKLPDDGGIQTRLMPDTLPPMVEAFALRQAQERKLGEAAAAEMRSEAAAAFEAIETQGTPALIDLLNQVRSQPGFLGGLLDQPAKK